MASASGSKKRKADNVADPSDDLTSPMSDVLRRNRVPTRRPSSPPTHGGWLVTNLYYYENCRSLYNQYVEHLNEEFREFFVANPNIEDYWWYSSEYLRRITKLKDLYQKPFVGVIRTCGMSDMESLGYEFNSTEPKIVKILRDNKDLKPVAISCGSTFTAILSQDGRVFTFGGEDNGALGREGAAFEGDLQVREFFPSKHASWKTPVANEETCIVKVVAGNAQTLYLTIHGNVYVSGTFRDYDDANIRSKPEDINKLDKPNRPDRNGKLFPFGSNLSPVHLYEMPRKVQDIASGTFMSAAILDNGQVATWGVGSMGELGRPVPDSYRDKKTGKCDVELLANEFLKPQVPPVLKSKVAISIACGQGHLMVVTREPGRLESMVWASGLNQDGQLGLGDKQNRKVLTPVEDTKDLMIAEVQAGSFHSLACTLDRKRVFACGTNSYGQCGLSSEKPAYDSQILTFQRVAFPVDDLDIEQIACGESHNLVIVKPKGGFREVYTWGSTVPMDDACVLGHGEADKNEYRPRKLVLKSKDGTEKDVGGVWRQVSGGAQHSVFLRSPPAGASTPTAAKGRTNH